MICHIDELRPPYQATPCYGVQIGTLFSIHGYSKIELWISMNAFMTSIRIMDIQKCIYGYPKLGLWISKIPNPIMDIEKSILDIHNSNYRYP